MKMTKIIHLLLHWKTITEVHSKSCPNCIVKALDKLKEETK